ncbi:surfactin family lipopeptide synthetase A [Thermoflexales bacterium]|nr:surfactin family lipopeptide synthetase A [Thermoflexales bacterium]
MPFTNLVEMLRNRSISQSNQCAYTFLLNGETEEVSWSYEELDRRARAIGAQLQGAGAARQRALLLFPPGLEYIAAFFGCLYAGVVAVPVYPPRLNRPDSRLNVVAQDSSATFALTTADILTAVPELMQRLLHSEALSGLHWIATDTVADSLAAEWQMPPIDNHTLAFLQYTSGSTVSPRGVMLTHDNLLHNLKLICKSFEATPNSRGVIWLPPYHDMGLIGGILEPVFVGFPVSLMSPLAFLERPFRWLQTITCTRATISGGPNFAYELCIQKIQPEQIATLDLSSWELAFNGAEPIRAETLKRFVERFGPCGFRPESFYPCYGLAETTLIATGGDKAAPPIIRHFVAADYERNRIVAATTHNNETRTLVSCGHCLPDQKIEIVDPQTRERCLPDQVGEVWLAGPSVAQGYWNRPKDTTQAFGASIANTEEGSFLRTGDLGFLYDGELFIAGRLKDLIIIRGYNYYPQDIELTVEQSHPILRPGSVVAFSIDVTGEERLVVVQELKSGYKDLDLDTVVQAIRQAISEKHGLQVHAVILARMNTIPKTSSGKPQRRACRTQFLEGQLKVIWQSVLDDSQEVPLPPGLSGPGLLQQALAAAQSPKARFSTWMLFLQEQASHILRIAAAHINVQEPLNKYGLDSLMAVELKNNIEAETGITLSLSEMLGGKSLAQLGTQLLSQAERLPDARLATVSSVGKQNLLSYNQRSLWFLNQLSPDSAAYNIACPVHIQEPVDAEALRRAFRTLVNRHAALRTNFVAPHGDPQQQVHEQVEAPFCEIDVSNLNESDLKRLLESVAWQPFDLEHEALLRICLFKQAQQKYILLLVVHHIIADFWSLAVLVRDFNNLYTVERSGSASALPLLTRQYSDYVRHQQDMLLSPSGDRQWEYWRRQLAGNLPILNLPTDHPRPATQTYRGALKLETLNAEQVQKLKSLGQTQGATLFMVLLGAFQALLQRYTHQDDILLGVPTSGRTRADWVNIVGYFVNPVVIRSDLSGDPTFEDYLTRVRETVLAAFEHQDYPFALLVERLQLPRDPSRSPLFQVMFSMEAVPWPQESQWAVSMLNQSGIRLDLGGLAVQSVSLESQTAQFDLTIRIAEANHELIVGIEYNTDLFSPEFISRLLQHYKVMLEGIISDPHCPLSKLPLLSEAELQQVLIRWNDTATHFPEQAGLHQFFEDQVASAPDTIAVSYEDQQLTYLELNRRANCVAHYLQSLGVGPEVCVGIFMERSLELVIGILGVLKACGAYIPFDPAYPKERLELMFADSGVKLVLSQQRLVTYLPDAGTQIVCLDTDWGILSQESQRNLSLQIEANNLAYVIYTSGSTGKPKGAMNTHGGINNRLQWMQATYGLTTPDNVLQKTPYSFDVSVWEFFWPLMIGARLVIARPGGHQDSVYLTQLIIEQDITVVHFVPAMLRIFLTGQLDSNCRSLRHVICSGETLPADLLPEFSGRVNAQLHNLYGPTEAAVDVTAWTCTREYPYRVVPIGRPIANTQIYLLDSHFTPVPSGCIGELYIGGVGVGRGYLDRPDLTAEKFVPNPFSTVPGLRLYRTGDLARYLPNGDIEFLGRTDYQVKVRGLRIELGDIEASLKEHPAIAEAVVLLRENSIPGEKSLTAYLVAKQPSTPEISELRQFLKSKLPEYMVPAAYVVLDTLPLSPNGKLDRQALSNIAPMVLLTQAAEEQEAADRPYQHPFEEVLLGIWTKLFGVNGIKTDTNFFDLGGHSLLATQLVSRIRETFHVELPVRVVFEVPTIRQLAAQLILSSRVGAGTLQPAIHITQRLGPLPLSFAQQRLWFLNQLMPDDSFYNMPVAVRCTGVLDEAALEASLKVIIKRHATLRTIFASEDGQPSQVIIPEMYLGLPVIDLRNLSEIERSKETKRLIREEAQHPFDLKQGPLLRSRLIRLSEIDHLFLLIMHHIVSDGWSMEILARELMTTYQAVTSGRRIQLPDLPIQYADFAVWQRQQMQAQAFEKALAYWKGQLADAPNLLDLPIDRPRPPVQTFHGATYPIVIPSNLVRVLTVLGQQEEATLFMTLLAAFQTLLYRYSGQEDMVIGTPVANRNSTEIENLIGFFVNMLALRNHLSGKLSFRDLLRQVREVCLKAYLYQDLPFEYLVEVLRPERHLSYTPIFQVLFALQYTATTSLQAGQVAFNLLPYDTEMTKFDLTLSLTKTEQGLSGVFEYNTDLFDVNTLARMSKYFQMLLQEIVDNPDQCIDSFPLLTEAEYGQLVGWNDTPTTLQYDESLIQTFEEQVAREPDRIAVVQGNAQLTYGELNRRANQLAHYLRKIEVRPETIVAVCLERSPEAIIALLGVMKSGGVYLPIDPTYPQERLALILSNAMAEIVLTEQSVQNQMPAGLGQTVCMDTDWSLIAQEPDCNPSVVVVPQNLAYVIYTSGSTGKPKGVLIPHQALSNLCRIIRGYYHLDSNDNVLQFASLDFDASLDQILPTLSAGAKLVLRGADIWSAEDFYRNIATLALTVVNPPTAYWHQVAQDWIMASRYANQHILRLVIVGGDRMRADALCLWHKTGFHPARLINAYGPTEATIEVSIHEVHEPASQGLSGQSISVGRPLPGRTMAILDKHGNPIPIGVGGELYIGGISLARGYLNFPELTAERFVPDPFSSLPGARLYKTGDRARYRDDGTIEILGRTDYQVKIRGFRVELGEIETLLKQHSNVAEAVILPQEDEQGDRRLVAYVVLRQKALGSSPLLKFLRGTLPNYMIPSAIIVLEALPFTTGGKIDRRALLTLKESHTNLISDYALPQDEIEQRIAAIWQDVLQLKRVGRHDNFFDLGGHSLLMVRVHSRLCQTISSTITMIDLFTYPTISSLAEHLRRSTSTGLDRPSSQARGDTRRQSMQHLQQFREQTRRARGRERS